MLPTLRLIEVENRLEIANSSEARKMHAALFLILIFWIEILIHGVRFSQEFLLTITLALFKMKFNAIFGSIDRECFRLFPTFI